MCVTSHTSVLQDLGDYRRYLASAKEAWHLLQNAPKPWSKGQLKLLSFVEQRLASRYLSTQQYQACEDVLTAILQRPDCATGCQQLSYIIWTRVKLEIGAYDEAEKYGLEALRLAKQEEGTQRGIPARPY